MTIKKAQKAVDEIFRLYEQFGSADYIGEPVSQMEHMSQSAELSILGGFPDEVILAAFFHDIGHICVSQNADNSMNGFGVKSHEKIGADYLRAQGFPDRVAWLVESHVQAKRYLTYKSEEYYNRLSEASKKTLELQGGKMNRDEAIIFEGNEYFEISIQLRQWDELAKEMNKPVIDLTILKYKALKILMASPPAL